MTQKYTTQNGIRKYNMAWSPPAATTTAVAVPFVNQSTALPVVSATAVAVPSAPPANEGGEEEIAFVPTANYDAAVTKYHEEAEPEIYLGGYNNDGGGDSLDELNSILAKYEVPAGMLSKLLEVKKFDLAEIIVDDSGSMNAPTDAKDPTSGKPMNRWWEAKYRISQMMELLAYVPSPPITIRLLNRSDIITLEKNEGELPQAYIQRTEDILLNTFKRNPSGTTPALEAIRASLDRNNGMKVLRYFMGDGVPNGGVTACRQIQTLIMNRAHPHDNPFTFMSCTNQDDQVEWMKTTEEKAPYCAEFDDYMDESREVLRDQGNAFPYSFGLHLVAQIVAAFNPHDLDAMDESCPFTHQTLDNLLGYQSSKEEYRYYFDSFREAQLKLTLKPYQRSFINKLPALYPQFESAAVASDIPAAVQYKQKVKTHSKQQMYATTSRSPAGDDCCVIL
ncbi:hypothetical protein ACHAXR_002460 [Thalassiosira sp. AJA248-18]